MSYAIDHYIPDDYYLPVPAGPPLQGDLWTNLPLPYRTQPYGTGLLITPSCDFMHDKAPLINYIALTDLEEFLCTAGGFNLVEQELRNVEEAARANPPHPQVAALLAIGVPAERVLSELEGDAKIVSSAPPKQIESFRALVKKIQTLRKTLQQDRLPPGQLAQSLSPKQVRAYKERVIQNQIADLHFLPPYSPLLPKPSVLLLRSISTCPVPFLRLAASCPTEAVWRQELTRRTGANAHLTPECPKPERILRLRPLFLQALMSRIAALFGRVGVPDLPRSFTRALVDSE